jgi:hypothetical protein
MADHFISLKRGTDGTKLSQFTTGTSSTAGDDVEVRIADVDGQGNPMTRKDVVVMLEGIVNALLSGAQLTNFPKL